MDIFKDWLIKKNSAIILPENIIIGGKPLMFDIIVKFCHRVLEVFQFFVFMFLIKWMVILKAKE